MRESGVQGEGLGDVAGSEEGEEVDIVGVCETCQPGHAIQDNQPSAQGFVGEG